MKRLSIVFDNNCLCIMMSGHQGTDIISDLRQEDFESFIPKKFKDKSSFTWDFEAETISINQPYKATNNYMTKECFIPMVTEPYPKLSKRYDEFLRLLKVKPINLVDEIRREMPEVAKLLGLS